MIHVGATGLSGLVGSRVRELLSGAFHWESFSRDKGFDVASKDVVSRILGMSTAEIVVHFAAFTDMGEAEKQKGSFQGSCYEINVLGTKNIATACARTKKHLIYISTDAVFDGEKRTPYTERDKPHPISWYGETKWLGEQEVLNSGCPCTIVRIAYPFRAQFEQKLDFFRKIIKKLRDGQKVALFRDTLFTPTFIDDIACALNVVMKEKPLGIYHVVGATSLSPLYAAQEIAKIFDLDRSLLSPSSIWDFIKQGGRPYPRLAAMSNKKLKKDLGVSMHTFSEALREIKMQLS